MSDVIDDLRRELANLKARVTHLETSEEYAAAAGDADTVDGFHAAGTPTANKLLALNNDAKLPASITGDADTLDGEHPAAFEDAGTVATHAADVDAHHIEPTTSPTANKPLALNAEAKLPASITGDADTLDGKHAADFADASHPHAGEDITTGTVADARIPGTIARDAEVSSAISTHADDVDAHHVEPTASPTANKPLALNSDAKLPASITGDADTVDGEHASAFADAVHGHAGQDITTGTVADARIAGTIARDSEVATAVSNHRGDVDAHHVEPTASPTANKPLKMNAGAKFPPHTVGGALAVEGGLNVCYRRTTLYAVLPSILKGGGTQTVTFAMTNALEGWNVDISFLCIFGTSPSRVVGKNWMHIAMLYNNVIYENKQITIAALGEEEADIVLSVAATGANNRVAFTFTNNSADADTNYGVVCFTFVNSTGIVVMV